MYVGMMLKVLAPGMEHAKKPNLCSQVLLSEIHPRGSVRCASGLVLVGHSEVIETRFRGLVMGSWLTGSHHS